MPIKIPKNFVRRRSSGNVLESIENPPGQDRPVSSFRVLDRHGTENSTFDGGNKLKRMSAVRPRTSPYQKRSVDYVEGDTIVSNRGSEGTHNSGSIGREDDTSGSARYSYGSTTPSSVDYESPTEDGREPPRATYTQPIRDTTPTTDPPGAKSSGFSIKAAGRSFSFTPGRKKADSTSASNETADPSNQPRERSVTESSYASTATPPRLDFGSDLGWVDTEFGNSLGDLLNRLDANKSVTPESGSRGITRTESEPVMVPNSRFSPMPRSSNLTPIHTRFDHSRPYDSSPYSVASMDSHVHLMSAPPVPLHSTVSDIALQRRNSIQTDDTEASFVRTAQDQQRAPTTSSRDAMVSTGRSDASLASGSPSRQVRTPQPGARSPDVASGSQWDATPKPNKLASEEDEPLFDVPTGMARHRHYVDSVLENKASRAMTQAEFEHYRSAASRDQDEEDEDETYEDDDEMERMRQAAKQRRKQEAHLAVYRQQMKKVTGEQPLNLPDPSPKLFLDNRATQSTSNLLSSGSTGKDWFGLNSPKASDDEDDEDVPLGVLQAHGFPSKSRPPSRMKSTSSQVNLRSVSQLSTYPAPQGSTRNDASAGGGGTVPIFARKLPADVDPYIGASLVNPANRASMAFSASPLSQMGQATPHHSLPPGGLVGIIDAEQRDKLTRRGSPNTQGTYGPLTTPMPNLPPPPMMPQIPRTMSMGNLQSQSGMPYGMPMSPSEQAQVQMSNSFNQLMQMQMAMMQQMMSMQNMTPQQQQMLQQQQQQMALMQQSQQLQGQYFPPPPNQRLSMASLAPSQAPGAHPGFSHSGLPSQQWGGSFGGGLNVPLSNAGYAPSIAPSERSNVGQPSRYRPVTSLGLSNPNQAHGQHSRTSTMSAQTVQYSLNLANQQSQQGVTGFQPPTGVALHRASEPLPNTTIRAVSKPKFFNIGARGSDDEDDEAGWQEMKKKKEARKSLWRRKPKEPQEAPEGAYYNYEDEISEIAQAR